MSESDYVMALHKSTDGGQSWNTYKITTTGGGGFAVAIDPSNDDIIYVGGYSGYETSLFKTIDGGDTWTDISGDISGLIYDIVIDPNLNNELYVGTTSGVFKSEDYGSTWIQPSSYFDVNCIKINPESTNEIFAAGWQGIYLSSDRGNTWIGFNNGLTSTEILSLDTNVPCKILYAGSRNGSVFKNNLLDLYSLIIKASSGGTTDPAAGIHTYNSGAEVTIEAIPDPDSRFNGWTGNVPQGLENDNPLTITMDWDKSITANFIWDCTLILASGDNGTTNPLPGTHIYDSGTEVTLTAVPDSGYGFSHWSGDVPQGHENDNPLTMTMYSDISLTANFVQQYSLTIAAETGGTTEPPPGTYQHNSGTAVTVTATANSGYEFTGWSGDASGTDNPITITMDSDKSVTAKFKSTTTPDDSSDKKGPCFIATAAYDSPLHPYVDTLRDFRDKYLMPSKLGRSFVHLYYKYSPPLAKIISKHKPLKIIARTSLLPLVALSYIMLHLGLAGSTALLVLLFALPVFFIQSYRRKPRSYQISDENRSHN